MKTIAEALVKAQKQFSPAIKTSKNPHFKSSYADLSAVIEAVIDGLNDNGIFLSQVSHECESGVTIETKFIHESGEEYSAGKLHVPASKHDAQGYGSALTYARRYALMAACGIAPEDDDGNAASRNKQQQRAANDIDQAKYQAILKKLQEASLIGSAELEETFKNIPASPEKSAVWKEKKDELKKVASQPVQEAA